MSSRSKKHRQRSVEPDFALQHANLIVPDQIEVIENGSSDSNAIARWQNMPKPGNMMNTNFTSDSSLVSSKRYSVRIEQQRVLEIQQSLAGRGFYHGEMTGVYDEETADAMRRFQTNQKISVTGYPTAHALKRLGLGNW